MPPHQAQGGKIATCRCSPPLPELYSAVQVQQPPLLLGSGGLACVIAACAASASLCASCQRPT